MIILGILLLAAAAVAAVELVIANDEHQTVFHMWRWTWQIDAFWLAVVGAAVLFVALLGLGMLKASGGRTRRLRRERRDLASENRRLSERADVAESTPAVPAEGYARQGEPAAGTHAAPADSYLHQNDPATPPPAATQPGSTGYVAPAGQPDSGEQTAGRG
jgi:hypothetical protein